VNTTCVLYEMLRGRWSFIFHLCDNGPLHSSPAFSFGSRKPRATHQYIANEVLFFHQFECKRGTTKI